MKKEKEEINEFKNLEWQLDEVFKTILAISSPSKEQQNIYGIGIASDEMMEDLNTYFTLNKEKYLKLRLLDENEVYEIDKIVNKLDYMLESMNKDEWFDINKSNQWNDCRNLSKEILKNIGRDNLSLKVEHINEYDKGGNLTIQSTTTKLEKNAI